LLIGGLRGSRQINPAVIVVDYFRNSSSIH
jgi:hypothetical protein